LFFREFFDFVFYFNFSPDLLFHFSPPFSLFNKHFVGKTSHYPPSLDGEIGPKKRNPSDCCRMDENLREAWTSWIFIARKCSKHFS